VRYSSVFVAAGVAAAAVVFSSSTTARGAIDFGDLKFWAGSGENRAALVVDFNDGATPESYAWGYRWSGGGKTAADMVRTLVEQDDRLYAKFGEFSWGLAVLGLGYDADGDGFALSDNTQFDSRGIAIVNPDTDPVDGGLSLDPNDHYGEGWWTAYFAYYQGNNGSPYAGGTWSESPVGISDRVLTSGIWDGLSYAPGFAGSAPTEPVAAVPEPATVGLAAVAAGMLLVRRRGRRAV
jgi:hypothetical protein